MRILQSSVFRAVCAIVIGVLLIKFPDNTVTGITVAIGVLFLISGLISCLTYIQARRHVSEFKIYDAEGRQLSSDTPSFPLVGVGSMILGLILALSPSTFISALMYIIGAILILGAINQFMNLIVARRFGHIGLWFWLLPTLILITGIYVIVKPMAPMAMAMLVLGWCTLVYGVSELINSLKFYSDKKKYERSQNNDDIPMIEEVEDEAKPL